MSSLLKESLDLDGLSRKDEMGLWLKTLRENAGLSQRDMARALSLDYYTFISQLENGRGKIPTARYRDWARVLKVNEREFVQKLLKFVDPITYDILFND